MFTLFLKIFTYTTTKSDKISFEEARQIFRKYDKNQNGSMDINEFRPAFMELISVPLAREQIQKGVKYTIKY